MSKRPQMFARVDQRPVNLGNTVVLDIPNSHILGAIEIALHLTLTTSSGTVTVADSALGAIPVIKRIQLRLDGSTIPLSVSGEFLDYWSHVDRPGSERLATSGTASGSVWDAVLRWEVAQSESNLTGAILLRNYGSVQLEIEFNGLASLGSGTGLAVAGNVEVWAELYDETVPIAFDNSLMHTLTEHFVAVEQTGDKIIDIPRGRGLERMLVIPENDGAYVDGLVTAWTWRNGQGFEPYFYTDYLLRARARRLYGGDDTPVTGLRVFDFRRAGNRDVIPLGDPAAAPYPQMVATIASGASLSNARLHIVREELENVTTPAA
ncbi:MAG: hypothetical protein M0R73_02540 [Dehalococcoidia bacterium]|nr:hypothetical protein [Dehalococcoidia bacterium]